MIIKSNLYNFYDIRNLLQAELEGNPAYARQESEPIYAVIDEHEKHVHGNVNARGTWSSIIHCCGYTLDQTSVSFIKKKSLYSLVLILQGKCISGKKLVLRY